MSVCNGYCAEHSTSGMSYEEINTTPQEERNKRFDKEMIKAVMEYKQFILNVLDGIDIADKEMGNQKGGTKAIRLAIESRIIVEPTNNTKEE